MFTPCGSKGALPRLRRKSAKTGKFAEFCTCSGNANGRGCHLVVLWYANCKKGIDSGQFSEYGSAKLRIALFTPPQVRGVVVCCPKCDSEALASVPAEIRLYRNGPRTMSHPPMSPAPDIVVCLDCGWSEFSIPKSWLSAGWLRSLRPEAPAPVAPAIVFPGLAVARSA
jgi:hypothetical protein